MSQKSSQVKTPKVSIIVPIYNTAKYLPACLGSILNQTYQNLEIILIDDGSSDNSPQIISQFQDKDVRITALRQKNAGQSTARNQGLKLATGDYISFVDSDDELAPTFIADLVKSFTPNTSLSLTAVRYKRLYKQTAQDVYTNPIRPRHAHESPKAYVLLLLLLDGRLYSVFNKLFKADLAKTCRFDKHLNFAEDTKFVLDYLAKSKESNITFILKPLYIYNFGTETSTIKSTATKWSNWQTSYSNLKTWLGPHPTVREKLLLRLIHLRWRISFIRSCRRARTS